MLRLIDRGLTILCVAAALVVLAALFAGPSLVGAKKSTPYAPTGDPGARVFADAGCGGCHTLKAAGARGSVGPNLDQVKPDAATVTAIVRSGGGGMPSFGDRLSGAQISALADYVSRVAGG